MGRGGSGGVATHNGSFSSIITPTTTAATPHPASSSHASGSSSASDAIALRERYEACAASFPSICAENVEEKMKSFSKALSAIYGELPFAQLDWKTSIMGTLVGLICAQTCKNSWSSIGYANLAATFPTDSGEPDWDLIRTRKADDIVPCIWHGPYFYRKAERIHGILERAYADSGEHKTTSLEHLESWTSEEVRKYLMGFNGLSGKSVACLLLYRMGRVDFAVDANVLRVMTRLGWLKSLGICATDGISATDRRAAIREGAALPTTTLPVGGYTRGALPSPATPQRSLLHQASALATPPNAKRRKLLPTARPATHPATCPTSRVWVRLQLLTAQGGGITASLRLECSLSFAGIGGGGGGGGVGHDAAGGSNAGGMSGHGSWNAAERVITGSAAAAAGGFAPRRRRCGACEACRSGDCGICSSCIDSTRTIAPLPTPLWTGSHILCSLLLVISFLRCPRRLSLSLRVTQCQSLAGRAKSASRASSDAADS